MTIYTKTGDKGKTSLYTGQRISKNHPLIETIGIIDECNSSLGVALSFLPEEERFSNLRQQLETIQHGLFDIGAALATPRTCSHDEKIEKTRFDGDSVSQIEQWIDEINTTLPPIHHFILPGGHPSGATLHLVRSICRTAERLATPLYEAEQISHHVLRYLNRLSDYLFIASRFVNHTLKSPEIAWEPHKGAPKGQS